MLKTVKSFVLSAKYCVYFIADVSALSQTYYCTLVYEYSESDFAILSMLNDQHQQ